MRPLECFGRSLVGRSLVEVERFVDGCCQRFFLVIQQVSELRNQRGRFDRDVVVAVDNRILIEAILAPNWDFAHKPTAA